MKFCLFGINGIAPGKHNLKDPRLDQTHKLVKAKKKTCAQVDVVEESELLTADAILTSHAALSDLLMKDLELVETRLGRNMGEAEKAALHKLAEGLTSEKPVSAVNLTAEELKAISAHSLYSDKPVVVAREAELADAPTLLVRAFKESGYISFLTVGGKENRAWPIRGLPRGGWRDSGQTRGQTAARTQDLRHAGLRRGELSVQ
jgi:ribosome-binding ATPase YchF (GTP1/OBG family)